MSADRASAEARVVEPSGLQAERLVVPAPQVRCHKKASHSLDFNFRVQEMGGSSFPRIGGGFESGATNEARTDERYPRGRLYRQGSWRCAHGDLE